MWYLNENWPEQDSFFKFSCQAPLTCNSDVRYRLLSFVHTPPHLCCSAGCSSGHISVSAPTTALLYYINCSTSLYIHHRWWCPLVMPPLTNYNWCNLTSNIATTKCWLSGHYLSRITRAIRCWTNAWHMHVYNTLAGPVTCTCGSDVWSYVAVTVEIGSR